MAAHVLTAHGLDVLLLEAGRQIDFEAEVRSLEWPYDHPRRGKLPPDSYVLNETDYKRAGAFIYMYGLGEVLPRYESRVELDPQVKDAFGIPVLRFSYRYGDNEKRMCADMVASMQKAFDAAGFETTRVDRDPLTEGSSVHELGTAPWGAIPKARCSINFSRLMT